MGRTAAAGAVLMAVLGACSMGQAVPSSSAATPVPTPEPTPVATGEATAEATVAATEAVECPFPVGIADVPYASLAQYAAVASGGVGIGEVVHVGPVQYATESGARPSCDELAAHSHGPIGRVIHLRISTPVAGDVEAGHIASYVLPGGRIGDDFSTGHHWNLEIPEEGDTMLVLLLDPPLDLDGGPGVLEQDVIDLFATDDEGRIVTPNPDETVTIDSVATLLDLPTD